MPSACVDVKKSSSKQFGISLDRNRSLSVRNDFCIMNKRKDNIYSFRAEDLASTSWWFIPTMTVLSLLHGQSMPFHAVGLDSDLVEITTHS